MTSLLQRMLGRAQKGEKTAPGTPTSPAGMSEQERDYLIAWLSTRDADQDVYTCRMRAKALALGLDWQRVPEQPELLSDEQQREEPTA